MTFPTGTEATTVMQGLDAISMLEIQQKQARLEEIWVYFAHSNPVTQSTVRANETGDWVWKEVAASATAKTFISLNEDVPPPA